MDHFNRTRKLAAIASLAFAGLAAPSGAGAQSTPAPILQQPETCSYADPMQQAQCLCRNNQIVVREQRSASLATQASYDPYLQNAYNVQPGQTSTYGAAPALASQVSQGCYGMTQSAFDSVFNGIGGLFGNFGPVFNKIMSSLVNSASGMVCQQVNAAIMSRTAISCPRVAIPGFPVNCGASLSVSSNGVNFNSNGTLGGLSGGTNANSGFNGLGSVNSNNNLTGSASTGTISVPGTAANAANSANNTVACWMTGSGC